MARLSHVLIPERPTGVEPALPPWQGGRLPLHHGRWLEAELSKTQEHRVGVEPTSPRYEGGIFATRRPVLVSGTGGYRTHIVRFKRPVHYRVCHSPESIGAEGVEPSVWSL